MVGRIIRTGADVAEGADWLAGRDPRFAHALTLTGPLPLRRRDDGFAQLLSAIVSQQISTAAAAAIWARLEAEGVTSADTVSRVGEDGLRALGLSRPKMRYALALADAGIDFEGLRSLPDAQVIATLTGVTGIGPWTAEIYAMFSLGRADVFASGDLALQEAARHLFDLEARPTEAALRELSEAWSPWRSVAARLLWSYYRHIKGSEGVR